MLRTMAVCCLVVRIATASVAPADGASYYVSPSGRGSACTNASPCSQAQAYGRSGPLVIPSTRSGPGDTVYLKGGTYGWIGAPDPFPSGTASARFVIKVAPGETVTVRGIRFPHSQSWVTIDGDYGLVLDGNFSEGHGILGAGHHVRIEEVEIRNYLEQGMMGCDEGKTGQGACELIRNYVHHIGQHANGRSSCFGDGLCHGFYISAPNVLYDGNVIHDIHNGIGIHPNVGGLDTSGQVVRNNRIFNSREAILAYGGRHHRIYNNLVYNNTHAGIYAWNEGDHWVDNNTVFNNGGEGIRGPLSQVRNNIVCNNRGGNISSSAAQQANVTSCPGGLSGGSRGRGVYRPPAAQGAQSAGTVLRDAPPEVADLCRSLGTQVINKGNSSVLSVPGLDRDFAGMPRPQGGGVDIGALECDTSGLLTSPKLPPNIGKGLQPKPAP
jgi:parallel beta-helix repeat protein